MGFTVIVPQPAAVAATVKSAPRERSVLFMGPPVSDARRFEVARRVPDRDVSQSRAQAGAGRRVRPGHVRRIPEAG